MVVVTALFLQNRSAQILSYVVLSTLRQQHAICVRDSFGRWQREFLQVVGESSTALPEHWPPSSHPADACREAHPHPTLGESIGMAAEVAHGSCTDVPPVRK